MVAKTQSFIMVLICTLTYGFSNNSQGNPTLYEYTDNSLRNPTLYKYTDTASNDDNRNWNSPFIKIDDSSYSLYLNSIKIPHRPKSSLSARNTDTFRRQGNGILSFIAKKDNTQSEGLSQVG